MDQRNERKKIRQKKKKINKNEIKNKNWEQKSRQKITTNKTKNVPNMKAKKREKYSQILKVKKNEGGQNKEWKRLEQ